MPPASPPRSAALLGGAALVVVATLATLAGVGGAPAQARPGGDPDGTAQVAEPADLLPLVAPLDGVALSGEEHAAAEVAFERAEAEAQAGAARLEQAEHRLVELEAEAERLAGVVEEATVERDDAARRLEAARDAMAAVAVDAYVQAGTSVVPPVEADPGAIDDGLARDALAGSVRRHHVEEHADATADHDAAARALNEARQEQVQVEADRGEADEEQAAAEAARTAADADLAAATEALEAARRTATISGTDLPVVAVDAYWRAASTLAAEQPSCGLRWTAVAGISRVEGRHGSFGTSQLGPDGYASPPIIGIPLDGTRGTRAIADTDGGALDGDTAVDRAVGPMQFIPSTWARYQRDGDGDGTADPHSLYDAALAAADYLCRSGPGLDGEAGLRRAFFSYNHSQAYVERVLGFTRQYDQLAI